MASFGYFHETHGYREYVGQDPGASVGAGWSSVPVKPGETYDWDGSAWVDQGPPAILNEQVDEERDRRLEEGVTIAVTGYGNIEVRARDDDRQSLLELAAEAQVQISDGNLAVITKYRAKDNSIHDLNPIQIFELWTKLRAWVQFVREDSWALKDASGGAPQTYQDNTNWPLSS